MNKDRLIKRIEENYDDIKDALIKNRVGAEEVTLLLLFRDYTDEVIRIIEEECTE